MHLLSGEPMHDLSGVDNHACDPTSQVMNDMFGG
jgi:hypothetical protein